MAGYFTAGRAGYFLMKSNETGGVIRAVPMASFSPNTIRGDATIDLVNNTAYAANSTDGITTAQFSLAVPMLPGAVPADTYTRIFGSVLGDDETKNYWTLTRAIDGTATAPDVYALAKFGGVSGSMTFSTNGAAQSAVQTFSGIIIDPLSGSVAALTAPAAGALSTGKVLGFSKTVVTGCSQHVNISWNISTGLTIAPGTRAGTNANYPVLAYGAFMQGLTGTVSITQARKAATVLGADGSLGTLILAIGGTGYGTSLTFKLKSMSVGMPSNLGANYMTSTYYLQSIDGTTSPFVVADL